MTSGRVTEQNPSDAELAEAYRQAYRARVIWGPALAPQGYVAAAGVVRLARQRARIGAAHD